MKSRRLRKLIGVWVFLASALLVASPAVSGSLGNMKLYQVKSGDLSLNKGFLTGKRR